MKKNWQLWLILSFAVVVIFYRLSHVDMVGDDAVYSARAVGLVDFMFTNPEFQSTPLQWFKEAPGWTRLSWHDHPLPLFLIQHVFLRLQESVLFAKLPYALLALGTIILTYLIWSHKQGNDRWSPPRLRSPRADYGGQASSQSERELPQLSSPYEGEARRGSTTLGLLAALFLALNAHFIWSGRVAYMESGVLFFISLALYALVRFIENKKWWWWFGLALGVALTVKFSTVFLVPTIALYVWLQDRTVYRNKRLYAALLLALVVALPVIIYNIAMYQATGHFSLQFARLFHQESPWRLSGVQTNNLGAGFVQLIQNIGQFVSWPYLFAATAGAVWLIIRKRFTLPLIALFFLTIQQVFIGQEGYLLTLYSIFLAPIIAMAAVEAGKRIGQKFYRTGQTAVAAFCLYLLFFVINSHSFIHHIGPVGWAHSAALSDNRGLVQLDGYLEDIISTDLTLTAFDPFSTVKIADRRLHRYLVARPNADIIKSLQQSRVILIDGNINWFARVWLMERRRFYYNTPIFTLNEKKFLDQMNIEKMYFVKATEYAPLDPSVNLNTRSAEMEKYFIDKRIPSKAEIRRDDGKVAFMVYEVDNQRLKINGP